MLHMMEIPGYTASFSPRQEASQTFPLQFLCDLAYAVLDDDTGDRYNATWCLCCCPFSDTSIGWAAAATSTTAAASAIVPTTHCSGTTHDAAKPTPTI